MVRRLKMLQHMDKRQKNGYNMLCDAEHEIEILKNEHGTHQGTIS